MPKRAPVTSSEMKEQGADDDIENCIKTKYDSGKIHDSHQKNYICKD